MEKRRISDLVINAFCSLSAGVAAIEELLDSDFRAHLFGFELFGGGGKDLQPKDVANKLLGMCSSTPCLLSPWWYQHCKQYDSQSLLLGMDSIMKVDTHVDLAELDNIS